MQSTPFVSSTGETRNPIYEGQFDGETPEQAEARRHWAKVAMEMARNAAAAVQPGATVKDCLTVGGVDERAAVQSDILCDCAYRNGLIAGFGFGINDDEAGYQRSLACYQGEIHEARAALSAPSHMVMEGVTVERDVFGTIHIKSGDFDFIQIRYQYPYTDNSGTWKLAERIVALLAAPSAGSQEQG